MTKRKSSSKNSKNQSSVRTIDYRGILYFIDSEMNVYKTEDIVNNVVNPSIIGRAILSEGGDTYSIEFPH
jgi:hypothetical protein